MEEVPCSDTVATTHAQIARALQSHKGISLEDKTRQYDLVRCIESSRIIVPPIFLVPGNEKNSAGLDEKRARRINFLALQTTLCYSSQVSSSCVLCEIRQHCASKLT